MPGGETGAPVVHVPPEPHHVREAQTPDGTFPEAVHPVIAVNQATGRKMIYVNEIFTEKIVELEETESRLVPHGAAAIPVPVSRGGRLRCHRGQSTPRSTSPSGTTGLRSVPVTASPSRFRHRQRHDQDRGSADSAMRAQ